MQIPNHMPIIKLLGQSLAELADALAARLQSLDEAGTLGLDRGLLGLAERNSRTTLGNVNVHCGKRFEKRCTPDLVDHGLGFCFNGGKTGSAGKST